VFSSASCLHLLCLRNFFISSRIIMLSCVVDIKFFASFSIYFLPLKLRPEGFQSSFLSQLFRNVTAPFMVMFIDTF
jgi:hypothetical protein